MNQLRKILINQLRKNQLFQMVILSGFNNSILECMNIHYFFSLRPMIEEEELYQKIILSQIIISGKHIRSVEIHKEN